MKIIKLIVGLGNPGPKYQKTRHNLGFAVIDALVKKLGLDKNAWSFHKKFNTQILECSMFHVPCSMIKPQTFMNNSGQAVAAIARYYKIKPQDIGIIYDDIDLTLGKLRVRQDGSSGGHKGVQSIIDCLGASDFVRFRLGIGPVPVGIDPADYVLSKFRKDEAVVVENMIEQAIRTVLQALQPLSLS